LEANFPRALAEVCVERACVYRERLLVCRKG
jgi:hypothetical protein